MQNSSETYTQVDVNNPETRFKNDNPIKIRYSLKQYDDSLMKGSDAYLERDNVKYNFGKVIESNQKTSGMDYKVIQSPNQMNKTVMFAGTNGFSDYVTDAWSVVTPDTKQAEDAYSVLLNTLKNTKGTVYVTGHSLGGMNAQYALAKLATEHPNYMSKIRADLYETPNIYYKLPSDYQKSIDKYSELINNYTKENDFIGLGMNLMKYDLENYKLVGTKIELEANWDDRDSMDVHELGQEMKENKLHITNFDFSKMEVSLMSTLKALQHMRPKENNVMINAEEITQITQLLYRVIETIETEIETEITNTKKKINNMAKEVKEQCYLAAPDLHHEEIESIYNMQITSYVEECENIFNEYQTFIKSWKEQVVHEIEKLLKASSEFKEFDKLMKNSFKRNK